MAIAVYASEKSMKHNIMNMMAMTKEKGKAILTINSDVNIVDALEDHFNFGIKIPAHTA